MIIWSFNGDFATAKYVSDLMGAQNVPTFVRWDTNTANTPYKAGLTGGATEGFAMVYGNYSTWLTAIAWVKGAGGSQYIFSVDQGNIKGWTQVASKDDLLARTSINISDMTLNDVYALPPDWSTTIPVFVNYSSALAPDHNTCTGFISKNYVRLFSVSGKNYRAVQGQTEGFVEC